MHPLAHALHRRAHYPAARLGLRPVAATLLAALVCLLAAAAPAAAALPVTFDGLAAGSTVSNQYSGDGIVFLDPEDAPGRPRVKDVGSKAHSGTKVAITDCEGCEFEPREILIRFPTLAATASFYLGIDSATPTIQNVTLETLGPSMTPIAADREIQVDANTFRQFVNVDPPGTSGTIAYLRLRIENGWNLGIDSINATFPPAVTPDFSVIPDDSVVAMRPGGSTTVQVDVPRFNGSSGAIDLGVSGLPYGVTASFSPDPLTGTSEGPSTLTLTAAGDTLPGTADMTITGAPTIPGAGPSTRSAPLRVIIQDAFSVSGPATLELTPCMTATQTAFVTRTHGFSGPITLRVQASEGWSVEPSETTLTGGGGHAVPLTIRSTTAAPREDGLIILTANSPGLRERMHTISTTRQLGQIDSFTPTSGSPPRELRGGTAVRISGSGFCEGASVQFGHAGARAPATVDPSGSSLTALVPRYATTGPLSVVMPGRTITSSDPFTAQGPRRTHGFRFTNYDHPGVDLGALTELYGAEQTQISIDPCNPLPGLIPPICPIATGIPNPLAAIYIGISNAALSGNGSCFGIATTAEHLSTGQARLGAFTPAGAATPWDLNARSGPAPGLAARIRNWHTAQLSSSYLGYWIDTAAANVTNGGRGSRTTVINELRAGRHPIIAIRNGGSGHVLVAHNLRDMPDGGYEVDVFDTNVEFLAGEETDGPSHIAREDASVIKVAPNGSYTYAGGFSPAWSGPPDHMVVAALSVMGNQPRMPTDPHGLVTLLVPLAEGGAAVEQVTDGDGKRLLGDDGDLNRDAATRAEGTITPTLSGEDSRTLYAIKGRSAGMTLAGNRGGTTGASILAPGFAAELSGLRTGAGSRDEVEIDGAKGQMQLAVRRGGTLTAKLARQISSTDQVGAQLRISGSDRGDHDVRLGGGRSGLRYENDGRGSATLRATISWSGKRGVPGESDLPAVTVPAGGSLQAAPSSWGKLASSPVRVLVKNRSGRVVRRVQVKPRASRIAKVRVSTRTRKGARQARVRVSFRGVPKRAKVQVGVHVRKGKRLVFSELVTVGRARGARTFTLPLGKLPAGRLSVHGTATVIDGAAVHTRRHTATLKVKS